MHIPDDLMELDLPMSRIKQIIWVREQKKKAQAVLQPSEKRKALAQKRIRWCDEAETALKNGQEPASDFPSGRDNADKETGNTDAGE